MEIDINAAAALPWKHAGTDKKRPLFAYGDLLLSPYGLSYRYDGRGVYAEADTLYEIIEGKWKHERFKVFSERRNNIVSLLDKYVKEHGNA